jgi:hypothetical protein
MSGLMVELHPAACACRGAMWMLPQGSASTCSGGPGTLSDAVVISAEQWRSLGKPSSIESHNVAAARVAARVRRTQ